MLPHFSTFRDSSRQRSSICVQDCLRPLRSHHVTKFHRLASVTPLRPRLSSTSSLAPCYQITTQDYCPHHQRFVIKNVSAFAAQPPARPTVFDFCIRLTLTRLSPLHDYKHVGFFSYSGHLCGLPASLVPATESRDIVRYLRN